MSTNLDIIGDEDKELKSEQPRAHLDIHKHQETQAKQMQKDSELERHACLFAMQLYNVSVDLFVCLRHA
ncbi:hypothetical protein SUGI_0899360 [Cryptomeria japonica]|nr:hypothetical protein SUGI_0899360 [Cryptomeria japonica]